MAKKLTSFSTEKKFTFTFTLRLDHITDLDGNQSDLLDELNESIRNKQLDEKIVEVYGYQTDANIGYAEFATQKLNGEGIYYFTITYFNF